MSILTMEQVGGALEEIDTRARCRDMATRWQNALDQAKFYERLMMAFAAIALVFVVIAVGSFWVNQNTAIAAVTFLGTVVTGAVSAFFDRERRKAQAREQRIFTAFNAACPNEDPLAAA